MRTYIKTITYVVQVGFVVAGIGFFAILIPELNRLHDESSSMEFRDKMFAGAFALAVCIAGVVGAALTRKFLLKRY